MSTRTADDQIALRDAIKKYAKEHDGKFYSLDQMSNSLKNELGFVPARSTIRSHLLDAGYTFQRGRYVKK